MSAQTGERRVLDEAGGLSAMTGVMAVMLFLTVLAAAAGLAAGNAARGLDRRLAGRRRRRGRWRCCARRRA